MKKNTLLFIGIGAAALGGYFLWKNRQAGASDTATTEADSNEKTDATVKAPEGKFFEALDKAKEVASTIKDAVVEVRAGSKKAKVRSGTKKRKYTRKQILDYCQPFSPAAGGSKKEYKKCLRTAKYKPSLPTPGATETL